MKSHMTQSVVVFAACALSSLGIVALAPNASAGTPGCVTRSEYHQVHYGMSKHRVQAIFETRGAFQGSVSGGFTRIYRVCNIYSQKHSVVIEYMDMAPQAAMVASKAWRPR